MPVISAIFPSYIFYEKFDQQQLIRLKKEFRAKDTLFEKNANQYSSEFKKDRPFYYRVIAPLRLTLLFVFPERVDALPFKTALFTDRIIRASNLFLYYFIIVLGILGAVLAALSRNKKNSLMFLFPLFHVIAYAMLLRYTENRYMVPAYPIFVIYAAYILSVMANRFFPKQFPTEE